MALAKLLLTPERADTVYRIDSKLFEYSISISSDIYRKGNLSDIGYDEVHKDVFLLLVNENEQLLENEKEFCRRNFIYDFELRNAKYKKGEPKKCKNCDDTRYSDKFCENCICLHLQKLFDTWSSGNEKLDKFIQESQKISSLPKTIIEWIPFDQFEDVRHFTDGGFCRIYDALWKRGAIVDYKEDKKEFVRFGNQGVVLKCLNESSNSISDKFLGEALNYSKIKSDMIVSCHGITRFPDSGNYAMVMEYKERNLRDYLKANHSKLSLKDRIMLFKYLSESLNDIHEKDFIHCDLHSGNILVDAGTCRITDLGLCGPVDNDSSNKTYGIVPYIAPEIFQGQKHTKASDVYSIGMIMWEIFSGCPPFDDVPHDSFLILQICRGLRPKIFTGLPLEYAGMMVKCWDKDPSKRPDIIEVFKFSYIFSMSVHKCEEGIPLFTNAHDDDITYAPKPRHSLAYHSSRILDADISKSIELKRYVGWSENSLKNNDPMFIDDSNNNNNNNNSNSGDGDNK